METEKTKSTETIKMVERALNVLDLLKDSRTPVGVNEIAKKVGINPSSCFRILKTLEKEGWVFQLSDNLYIAGKKISFVTEKNNLYLALQDVSKLIMQKYTEKYSQAMNLMVRDGNHCVILQQSRTNNIVDYVPPLYSKLAIHSCACGKVLLSGISDDYRDEILDTCDFIPLTEYTITDKKQFVEEVKLTAIRGYAMDNKESTLNGSCIAVPVRDDKGDVIAALSFSGFIIPHEDINDLMKYYPVLCEAAEKISRSIYMVSNNFR